MAPESRERKLVLIAAVCVGAFLADRVVVTPLTALWAARRDRIAELHKSLANGQSLLDREKTIRSRWSDMKSRALPADASRAEEQILQAVSRWTQTSRLGVESLQPQWIEDAKSGSARIECRLSAQASLASLARFIYELGSDRLAIRLVESNIAARDDSGRNLTVVLRFSGLALPGDKP